MSLFGLSLGSTNQTDTKNTVGKSDTTGTQTGTQNTTGSQNTSTTGSQNTTTAQTGTSNTAQTGKQDTSQITTSQSLGDNAIQLLNTALGGILNKAVDSKNPVVSQLGAFDPEQFVAQTLRAAQSSQNQSLGQTLGGIRDAIGGGVNSAVALLSQNAHDTAASNLAGIASNATATANQILQGNSGAITTAEAGTNSLLNTILSSLKGATTTETGAGTTASSQAGTSATSESGTSGTTSTSDVVSSLSQILTSLLKNDSTTNTNATTTDNVKKDSAGLSLGF